MCCGASRSVGLRPNTSLLLGEDDGSAARYMKVLDGTVVPGAAAGSYRYFRGTLVDQALEEGKITDASQQQSQRRTNGKTTVFIVTLPDSREIEFASYATARQYAMRNGGTTRIEQKEPEDG